MKTKNFKFKSMALVLFALVLSSNVWGEDVTYKFTPNATTTGNSSSSYVTSAYSFTYNEIGWSFNQWNPSTLQIKTNQASATSEFNFKNTSAFPGKIKSVVITFSALTVSDASGLCFVGGSSAIADLSGGSAGSWNSTAKTLTWTPAETTNYTYFAFYQNGKVASGTNNLASSNAIVITYEKAASKTLSSIAVTTQPTKKSYTTCETLDLSGCVVTATYSDAPTEDVTSSCTFYPADGAALTKSVTSVAVSYSGKEATITEISVTDGARDTFKDNVQETADQYGECNGYTIPSCSDVTKGTGCGGEHYKFIGWSSTQIPAGTQPTEPAGLLKAGETHNADGTTYYAVWAAEE